MSKRTTATVVAAMALAATLTACTGEDDESQPRHADAVATLGPSDNSVQGEFIVNGSTVVVLDMLGDGKQLYGYDIDSGTEQWSMPTESFGYVWLGSDFFAFQPDEKRVEIRELNTGKLRHEIELEPKNAGGVKASLVGASNLSVFVTNPKGDKQEELSALDARSGDELWTRVPAEKGSFTAVRPVGVKFGTTSGLALGMADSLRLASDAPVIAVADSGKPGELTALDVHTGEDRWTVEIDKGEVPWPDWSGEPSELVSLVTAVDDSTSERTLTAFHMEPTISEQVTVKQDVYDAKERQWRVPAENEQRLLVADSFVFAQDGSRHPQLTNMRTGDTAWTAEHEGEPMALGDNMAVYQRVGKDGAGKVYAVDSPGVLWKSDAIDPDGEAVIVDGQLLVEVKDGVEVYDVKTGEPQWRFQGSLLGWNDDYYLFKKTENDQAIKVVARDGR